MPEPQPHRTDPAPAGSPAAHEGPDEREARRSRLLGMRVSRILDANEAALAALVEGGFGPLANPVMRLAMAHTVNLQQAFRIRGQPREEQEALVARLLELGVDLGADAEGAEAEEPTPNGGPG